LLALFTFGEGYHNYHHEFQHDYRNGVKPWQWDPTKWLIWSLSKLGLINGLRRVPAESISRSEAKVREEVTGGQLSQRYDLAGESPAIASLLENPSTSLTAHKISEFQNLTI
jgi:cytochrome b involved in lipid metabolism